MHVGEPFFSHTSTCLYNSLCSLKEKYATCPYLSVFVYINQSISLLSSSSDLVTQSVKPNNELYGDFIGISKLCFQ